MDYTDTWPDGSSKTWPDGTPRSFGNGFTHVGERPHGYVSNSPVAPTPTKNTKRGPRSVMAFAQPDGVIPNMGDRVPRKNQPVLVRRAA